MANFNASRIKSRIKTSNGATRAKSFAASSSGWLANATKSVGISIKDVGSEMAPSTFEISNNIAREFSDMRNFLKNFNRDGGIKNITKGFENDDLMKDLKKMASNAKEDLKSGKFNNQDREFDMFDTGDFDFSFDDTSDNGDSAIVDAGNNDTSSNESGGDITPGFGFNAGDMADSFNAQTELLSRNLKANAEVNYAIGTTQLQISKEFQIQVGAGLRSINDNLAMLVKFNTNSMSAYIKTSMQYYNDNMGAIKELLDIQKQISSPNAPPKDEYKENPTEDFLNSNFSFSNYAKLLKANTNKAIESNLFLSMGKMLKDNSKMFMGDIVANPLKIVTDSLVKKFIPKAFEDMSKSFDETITNIVPAMLMKINRGKNNWDNPLSQIFSQIFGINTKYKTYIDLSKYNNGPIPFDGETKKAIVEVMPTYLRKILAVLSGEKEQIFDHTDNEFKTMQEVEKDLKSRRDSEITGAYTDSTKAMFKNLKGLDYNQEANFKKKYEKFLLELSKQDSLVDINNKSNDFSTTNLDYLLLMSGMSQNEIKLFNGLMGQMTKGQKLKMFGRDVLKARSNNTRFMDELENDPNRFLANRVFGSANMKTDTHLDKKGNIKQGFGLFDKRDKFGNGSLDYLRNIQDILIKGIKVFVTPKNGRENNAAHLKEYRNRMTEENSSIGGTHLSSSYEEDTGLLEYDSSDIDKFINTDKGTIDNESIASKKLRKKAEEANTKTSKTLFNTLARAITKPFTIVNDIMGKVDNTLYNIVFGDGDEEAVDENGNIKKSKSFISSIGNGISKYFINIKDWTKEHIMEPLKESLFGEKGIITQIKDSKMYKAGKEKWEDAKNYMFGEKDEEGFRKGGAFQDSYNYTKDLFKSMSYYFTGHEYINSKGETIEANPDSVFGQMKSTFKTVGESMKLKWLGKKGQNDDDPEQEGIITKGLNSIHEGFQNFSKLIFGKKMNEKGDEVANTEAFTKKFKEALPKSLSWGLIGGGLSIFSPVGVLGSLFLPGGPVGGMMLGMTSSFLSQSDKFKDWLLGPKDPNDNNNRIGGIIKSSTQNFLKKNKVPIVGGAGLGAIKGLILGNGVLGSMVIGGPIGGAISGMAASMVYKSEKFQKFLFGDVNEETGKRSGGILSKLKFKSKDGKDLNEGNRIGNMFAGGLGGAAFGGFVSQFGLLGSMLTLGSGPLMGSILGAATGISLSSKKFQKWMFGELDEETGKRSGGIVTKAMNKFTTTIMGPVRDAFDEVKMNVGNWFSDKILLPVQLAMDPIIAQFKYLGDAVKEIFSKAMNTVVSFVKEEVVSPIGKLMKAILNPVGKIVKSAAVGGAKVMGSVLAAPFSLLGGVGSFLEGKQEKRGVRKYKQGVDEDYRETRNAEQYASGKLSEDAWRQSVQKKKGLMSDEDWTEYMQKYANTKKFGKMQKFYKKYLNVSERTKAAFGEEGAWYSGGKSFAARKEEMLDKNKAEQKTKRDLLKKQKEQTKFRKQFAEKYGYDNKFKGQDKSFIYDANTEFKRNDKTGEIEAWKNEAKTETSVATQEIKVNTSTTNSLLQTTTGVVDKIGQNLGDKIDEVVHWQKVAAGHLDESAKSPEQLKGSKSEVKGKNDTQKALAIKEVQEATTGPQLALPAPKEEKKKDISSISPKVVKTAAKAAPGRNVLQFKDDVRKKEEAAKEASYKKVLKDSIVAIDDTTKKHFKGWDFIFGKKGLITLALMASLPVLMKIYSWLLKRKNGEWSGSGNPNAPGGPGEGMARDKDGYDLPIYNTQLRGNLTKDALKKLAKKFGRKTTAKVVKDIDKIAEWLAKKGAKKVGAEGADDVTEALFEKGIKQLMPSAAEKEAKLLLGDGTSKALSTAVKHTDEDLFEKAAKKYGAKNVIKTNFKLDGQFVQNVSKPVGELTEGTLEKAEKNGFKFVKQSVEKSGAKRGVFASVSSIMNKAFDAIAEHKYVKKYLGKNVAPVISKCKEIMTDAMKYAATKSSKYLTKFGAALTKFTAMTGIEVTTGGLAVGAFAIYDIATGATKTESAHLFQVPQEEVDGKMRGISSIIKVLLGLGNIGPIVDVVTEVICDMTGFDFKTFIAGKCYAMIGGSTEELKAAQSKFDKQWKQFQATEGNSKITKQEYNNLENNTWFSKHVTRPLGKWTGLSTNQTERNLDMRAGDKVTFGDRVASMLGQGLVGLLPGKSNQETVIKVSTNIHDFFRKKIYNSKGRRINLSQYDATKRSIKEWNEQKSLDVETRTELAYEYYWNIIDTELVPQYGDRSLIPEDAYRKHFNMGENEEPGELPLCIQQLFGLGEYDVPGAKWRWDEKEKCVKVISNDDIIKQTGGRVKVDENGELVVNVDAIDEAKSQGFVEDIKSGFKSAKHKVAKKLGLDSDNVMKTLGKKPGEKATMSDRLSVAMGEFINGLTFGHVKTDKAAKEVNEKIETIKSKALDFWEETKTSVVEGTDNFIKGNFITSFLKTDEIKEDIGLDEKQKLTLKDRLLYGLSYKVNRLTLGKVDTKDAFQVINGSVLRIADKSKEMWSDTKKWWDETTTKIGEDTIKAAKKMDKKFGEWFGFQDDNGNPLTLTEGVQDRASEISEGIRTGVKDIKKSSAEWWANTKVSFANNWDTFKDNVEKGYKRTDELFGGWFGFQDDNGNPMTLSAKVKEKKDTLGDKVRSINDIIKKKALGTWDTVKKKMDEIWDAIASVPGKIDEWMGGFFSGKENVKLTDIIKNKVKSVVDWGEDLFSKITESVKDFFNISKSRSRADMARRNSGGNGGRGGGKGPNTGNQPFVRPRYTSMNPNSLGPQPSDKAYSYVDGQKNRKPFGKGPNSGSSSGIDGSYGLDDKVNGFAYNSQGDPRWGWMNYYEGASDPSIADRGCGPTAFSMVAEELNQQNYSVPEVANIFKSRGHSMYEGTSHAGMSDVARYYGISPKNFSASAANIRNELKANRPVILVGAGSAPFTNGGHYITLTGVAGNRVIVNDPISKERSHEYNLNAVASMAANAWSYSGGNPFMLPDPNFSDFAYQNIDKNSPAWQYVRKSNKEKMEVYQNLGVEGFNEFLLGKGPDDTLPGINSPYDEYGRHLRQKRRILGKGGVCGMDIVKSAKKLVGKPYIFGGNVSPLGSSSGTDCSGLCQWAYNDNGIKISRSTYTQIHEGREVKKDALLPGDLIFTRHAGGDTFEHVFMYAGNGQIVEASQPGEPIAVNKLRWESSSRARRILSDADAAKNAGKEVEGKTDSTYKVMIPGQVEEVMKISNAMGQLFGNFTDSMLWGKEFKPLDWDAIEGNSYEEYTTSTVTGPDGKPLRASGLQAPANMPSSAVDKGRMNSKQSEFINKIVPGALEGFKQHGIIPSLTLAQAALESGWGDAAIGNNVFGIKAGSGWTGKVRYAGTTEQDSSGNSYAITDAFRDYNSIEEGVLDHTKLLATDHYAKVRTAKNYREANQYVKDCGYATAWNYPQLLNDMVEGSGLAYWDGYGQGIGSIFLGKGPLINRANKYKNGRLVSTDMINKKTGQEYVDPLTNFLNEHRDEAYDYYKKTGDNLGFGMSTPNQGMAPLKLSVPTPITGAIGNARGVTVNNVKNILSSESINNANTNSLLQDAVGILGGIRSNTADTVSGLNGVGNNTYNSAYNINAGRGDLPNQNIVVNPNSNTKQQKSSAAMQSTDRNLERAMAIASGKF